MDISKLKWVLLYSYLVVGIFSSSANPFLFSFFLQNTEIQLFENQFFKENSFPNQIPPKHENTFVCNTLVATKIASKSIITAKTISSDAHIVVRIAIVASPSYSNYFIEKYNAQDKSVFQKKEIVKKALQKSVNEVNKVLLRDLNVQLKLIDAIDDLIFVSPHVLFNTVNNHFDALKIAQAIIPTRIDDDAYDLGHIFSTHLGGASGKNTAFSHKKWQGSTGAQIPEGDRFNIDYFAHEIGHQLGASHTQNASCSRNFNSSVEVNSGISIMSYAGICSLLNSNVSNHSAPFYHVFSIQQIQEHLGVFFQRLEENNPLEIEYIPDYQIPIDTAFEIEITTNKKDTSVLFNCEQVDHNKRNQETIKDSEFGPSFISPILSYKNVIPFPPMLDVLNGNFYSEFNSLSKVPRIYTFMASAKSIKNTVQSQDTQKIKIITSGNEKFEVTTQNDSLLNWSSNEKHSIKWNANTISKAPYNTNAVSLFLALDGFNFNYEIAQNIPNTGVYEFLVPKDLQSDLCRIKIKATDNIFYAVNNIPFSINKTLKTKYTFSDFGFIVNNKAMIEVDREFTETNISVHLKLTEGKYEDLVIDLISPNKTNYSLVNLACETILNKVDITLISDWFNNSEKLYEYDLCPNELIGCYPFKERLKKTTTNGAWQLKISNHGKPIPEKLIDWEIEFIGKGNKILTEKNVNNGNIIYPIPTSDKLWIKNNLFNTQTFTGSICNTLGIEVMRIKFDSKTTNEIDVNQLESGVYFLNILGKDINHIEKIIID